MKKYQAALSAAVLFCLCGCSGTKQSADITPPVSTAETAAAITETVTVSVTAPAMAVTSDVTTAAETVAVTEAVTETTQAETTAAESATETAIEETTVPAAPYIAEQSPEDTEWMLLLVNQAHPIGEYVPPELKTLSNGVQIDARIYPALQEMYNAMYAAGYSPYTREGFRTYEAQKEIMDARIARHLAEGYTVDGARIQAEKYVAVPGMSEHQTGLAVDINAADSNSWPLYGWLSQHAYEYGFIMRYPQGAEEITGFQYEPWHYRYVGTEAAAEITIRGITLEEYLS